MPKRNKLPPLRNNEVRVLEIMTDSCMLILNDIESGKEVNITPDFLRALCLQHIHLYSRLIDANYVRRIKSPLVPLDTQH